MLGAVGTTSTDLRREALNLARRGEAPPQNRLLRSGTGLQRTQPLTLCQ